MITKSIQTEHGNVQSTVKVLHSDSGHVILHVCSTLQNSRHETRTTVGAEDGCDMVGSMTEQELRDSLQTHIDEKRQEAAKILAGRIKVSKITALLT